MSDRSNISEEELISALGFGTSAHGNAGSPLRGNAKGRSLDRDSIIDDGLLIDALMVDDPINERVIKTQAHQDTERNRARQMQLEASRDRTRAWREEVARQKSRSKAAAPIPCEPNEDASSGAAIADAANIPPEQSKERSASSQVLEVFGPKSVNVDYGKSKTSPIAERDVAVAIPHSQRLDDLKGLSSDEPQVQPAGHGIQSPRPAASQASTQARRSMLSNGMNAKDGRRSYGTDQGRSSNSQASKPTPASIDAGMRDPGRSDRRFESASQRSSIEASKKAQGNQRQELAKVPRPDRQAKGASEAQQASSSADYGSEANPNAEHKLISAMSDIIGSKAAKSAGSEGEPSVAASIDTRSPKRNSSQARQLRGEGEEVRSLSLIDASTKQQTVYSSASLATQRSGAYDRDLLSDIRQKSPRRSGSDPQLSLGREVAEDEIFDPQYEQPIVHSNIGPIGIALIIIAVLCVLIAVSLMTGLWDMSNVAR